MSSRCRTQAAVTPDADSGGGAMVRPEASSCLTTPQITCGRLRRSNERARQVRFGLLGSAEQRVKEFDYLARELQSFHLLDGAEGNLYFLFADAIVADSVPTEAVTLPR